MLKEGELCFFFPLLQMSSLSRSSVSLYQPHAAAQPTAHGDQYW